MPTRAERIPQAALDKRGAFAFNDANEKGAPRHTIISPQSSPHILPQNDEVTRSISSVQEVARNLYHEATRLILPQQGTGALEDPEDVQALFQKKKRGVSTKKMSRRCGTRPCCS